MFNGIETLNIAFVMDDIADTFELDSFTRGLVGGAGFLGERKPRRIEKLCTFLSSSLKVYDSSTQTHAYVHVLVGDKAQHQI